MTPSTLESLPLSALETVVGGDDVSPTGTDRYTTGGQFGNEPGPFTTGGRFGADRNGNFTTGGSIPGRNDQFTTGGSFGTDRNDRFTTGGRIGGPGTFTTGDSF